MVDDTLLSDTVFLYSCFAHHSLRAKVQFHCSICMSGVSQRGCRMTSAPTDPQSCCHPSSPYSPSWMVWSPSNRGQGSPLMDQRLLGNQSILLGPTQRAACLAGWLTTTPSPPFLTLLLPLSLVMAKWRRCSSHFSTPRCTWISCYRIRNASACQGLAALKADVSVLSTGLHFHQYLDWEAERQQLIKFQKRISFLSWYRPWRSADQRLHWCTIASLPMNFFQHIGAFLRAITPPLQSSLGSSFGSFPHGSMWI